MAQERIRSNCVPFGRQLARPWLNSKISKPVSTCLALNGLQGDIDQSRDLRPSALPLLPPSALPSPPAVCTSVSSCPLHFRLLPPSPLLSQRTGLPNVDPRLRIAHSHYPAGGSPAVNNSHCPHSEQCACRLGLHDLANLNPSSIHLRPRFVQRHPDGTLTGFGTPASKIQIFDMRTSTVRL